MKSEILPRNPGGRGLYWYALFAGLALNKEQEGGMHLLTFVKSVCPVLRGGWRLTCGGKGGKWRLVTLFSLQITYYASTTPAEQKKEKDGFDQKKVCTCT